MLKILLAASLSLIGAITLSTPSYAQSGGNSPTAGENPGTHKDSLSKPQPRGTPGAVQGKESLSKPRPRGTPGAIQGKDSLSKPLPRSTPGAIQGKDSLSKPLPRGTPGAIQGKDSLSKPLPRGTPGAIYGPVHMCGAMTEYGPCRRLVTNSVYCWEHRWWGPSYGPLVPYIPQWDPTSPFYF